MVIVGGCAYGRPVTLLQPDVSAPRCVIRKQAGIEGYRPHVCVEPIGHLERDRVPHRCTCGFEWWS